MARITIPLHPGDHPFIFLAPWYMAQRFRFVDKVLILLCLYDMTVFLESRHSGRGIYD